MFCLGVISFLLLSSYVHAEAGLLDPCSKDDLSCLQKSCTAFMNATAAGLGEPFNIEPLDPLTIAERTVPACCDDPPTGSITSKNIVVKGLKDVVMTGFHLSETEKDVHINLTTTLHYESDIIFKYGGKTFSGKMEAKDAQVKVLTHYPYTIEADDKGEKHFKMGPEHIMCEVVKAATITLNSELENALKNDPDEVARMEKYREQITQRKMNFGCDIVEIAMPRAFKTWRLAVAKMPLSTVLTDVS